MYSNDIVLDKEYCKFYRNIEASYQKFLPEEKFYLNKSCLKIESMNKLQYIKSKNIKNHIISKIIQTFIGEYSFLFFRELIAQLSFKLKINADIGRVSYIKKWEKYQNEAKLLGLLIKKSYDYCKKNNCNIEYFISPNVENISKESSTRSAMLSFTNRIKKVME